MNKGLLERFSTLLGGGASLKRKGDNLFVAKAAADVDSQQDTCDAFSEKWEMYDYDSPAASSFDAMIRRWYLQKYGFPTEQAFAEFLQSCDVVLDAGAGAAVKAAWFAELSPRTLVIAADLSSGIVKAADRYAALPNLLFVRCDIARMSFLKDGVIDYTNCDEVIHHTSDPPATFAELCRITRPGGQLATYVYRRKALPRELLDEDFRSRCLNMDREQLVDLAKQLTELGRMLSDIPGEYDFPAIPALGIEGGPMTIQRFIYWNFLKCYWNTEAGWENSVLNNFDWYSPTLAFRYSKEEFQAWVQRHSLDVVHFHAEHACYCGRFRVPIKP